MGKYRIEFNTSGFYYGQGVWECIDEFDDVEADSAEEAIELAKDWWIEQSYCNGYSKDEIEKDIEEYAWRAAEIKYDEDGYLDEYNWQHE